MKRRLGAGVGVVLVALALLLWRCRDDATHARSPAHATAQHPAGASGAVIGVAPKQKPDPRTLPKGTISGTVRDDDKRPIGGARVCLSLYSSELPPDFWEEAPCKSADANGAYAWTDLFVADYAVRASARGYRFGYHYPKGKHDKTTFALGPGEHKQHIDVLLTKGGVEITGVVNDISGGPIAKARVRASMGTWGEGGVSPFVETDDAGAFALWVPQGQVRVSASADGYAKGSQPGRAPGTFEILLTPEGSLAGIVLDARTERPVEGADVHLNRTQWEGMFSAEAKRTDEHGAFRFDGLSPGRYTAVVHGKKGYGRTAGSTLVGLGQHVTGVVVRVHPTTRVIGKVIVAGTNAICTEAAVNLHDEDHDRWVSGTSDDDGTVTLDGLLPGTYKATVYCSGQLGRDAYDPIVVADQDLTGLTWEVDDEAKIVGRVTTKSGAPVADANITAELTGGAARDKQDWNRERTDADGSFEIRRLKSATYRLVVESDAGVADKDGYKVSAKTGTTVTRDIVLDDGGTLTGTVVDEHGRPVANVEIDASSLTNPDYRSWGETRNKSDATGAFTIAGLRPGEYRVTATRGWDSLRKPGTNDDARQGERTTIAAGQTATVRLVVESQAGTIKGTVIDADGTPVSDAFISSSRESDAAGAAESGAQGTRGWGWGDDKPVLANVDGTFTVSELAPGKYTLRAFRKGGGEALAEHVAVGTANAKLQIKHTGAIEGTVKMSSGPVPEEISMDVQDLKTGFSRSETFFRTSGHFTIHDLPAGHFHLSASAAGGQHKLELDLASGEHKTGVLLTLEALVTLTGRVVDHLTKAPISGIRVFAQIAQGGGFSFSWSDDMDNTSDESGRFTVKRAPRGKLSIQGMAKEWKDSDYSWFRVIRDLTTSTGSTIDLGDIGVIKRRVKAGDPGGEMGLRFKEQPPETPADAQEIQVSFIDPAGPAAKTEIKVGDVIVTVDGVDVVGANTAQAWTLMNAPAGTKLVLGLARGATITLTLAPRS